MANHQEQAADIEADFPGWRVWRTTDAGTWWATRLGRSWREPRTVAADTAEGLRAELHNFGGSTAPGGT